MIENPPRGVLTGMVGVCGVPRRQVCRRMYRARRTLILRFEDDSIDESESLFKVGGCRQSKRGVWMQSTLGVRLPDLLST